jgi:hypothetical protein
MANLRALVLSDLHFGEESSVVHYGGEQANKPQLVVKKLVELIRREAEGKTIPLLIFAGDTLDLSLASYRGAVKDFQLFLDDVYDCFDKFVYIPGNHDHHIWRALQEQLCVVRRIMTGEDLEDFPQEQFGIIRKDGVIFLDRDRKKKQTGEKPSDPIEDEKALGAETFLEYLLPGVRAEEKGNVKRGEGVLRKPFAVTYPNLFLEFENSARNTLITHGHFFEPAWTLAYDMLRHSLAVNAMDYRKLEQINSPVTEFGWYGIGQAGPLGDLIGKIYKEIKNANEATLTQALDDLIRFLDEQWKFKDDRKRGFLEELMNLPADIWAGLKEGGSDLALRAVKEILTRLIKSQFKRSRKEQKEETKGSSLRYCSDILTDENKLKKVCAYISYAKSRKFTPGQIVFGHTHIPIQGDPINYQLDNKVWVEAMAFNPGGWIVDSDDPKHVISSCPMPLLISDEGEISWINDFPWPREDEKNDLNGMSAKAIREKILDLRFEGKPLNLKNPQPVTAEKDSDSGEEPPPIPSL